MHESQERSPPGFDEQDAAVFSKHAVHLRKRLLKVVRQRRQMVQAALHNEHVLAAVRERKLAAVGYQAFCRTAILRDQAGRQIHALQTLETQPVQSRQAVSPSAKELNNLCVARPLRGAQSTQALRKFLNFLFRRFESQVCGFPSVGRQLLLPFGDTFGGGQL